MSFEMRIIVKLPQDQVDDDLETIDHDRMRQLFQIPKDAKDIESHYQDQVLSVSYLLVDFTV